MWNEYDGMTEQQWEDAVTNAGRRIKTKVVINGSTTLYGDGTDGAVVSITINEALDTTGGISMGTTCSSSCEVSIRMPSAPLALTNGTIEPYVGLYDGTSTGYMRLGFYYITKVDSNSADAVVKITGYDILSMLTETYTPTVSFPATCSEIFTDITTQYNLSTTYSAGSWSISEYKEGTVKEWLGWIAGTAGRSVAIRRDGSITNRWYPASGEDVYTIPEDMQYQGGVTTDTQEELQVTSITSGTEENPIVTGNGYGFSYSNPYITQSRLDWVSTNRLKGDTLVFAYRPMTIEWRGNPRIIAGDRVTVVVGNATISTLVMARKLVIEGGMKDTLYCYGKSEREVALDTSPTSKKIQAVYNELQNAMLNAWALINGTRGGVFEVTDSDGDGINDGFMIRSNPNPNTGGNVIVANSSGIGFSADGGQSFNVAITTDGHINGEYITAGTINAESIGVGDGSALTDYIYIGHRRPDVVETPMVIRIISPASGMVQEIRGNRTSIFYASDVQAYITNTSMTDDQLDALARMYYTDTEYVLQKLDNFRIGDMVLQAQAGGGVKFVGAT